MNFLRNSFFRAMHCVAARCAGAHVCAQLARPSGALKHNLVLSSVAHRMLRTSYAGSLLCALVHLNSFALDLKVFQRPDFKNTDLQHFAKSLAKGTSFEKKSKKEGADIVPTQKIPNWLVTLEERSQILRFMSPTDDEVLGSHHARLQGTEPSEFYIFASLGLRQKHLKALVEDARRFKGVVVIRGLKNNSFQDTIAYLQSVLRKDHEGIQIDPTLFRKYNVTSVPTFVLARRGSFDTLSGNVTARFVLSKMEAQGDLAFDARQRLNNAK